MTRMTWVRDRRRIVMRVTLPTDWWVGLIASPRVTWMTLNDRDEPTDLVSSNGIESAVEGIRKAWRWW